MMAVSDEAVYAAASSVYGSGFDGSHQKVEWLRDFRIALEAAAPLIKEQVLREAALSLMDVREHESRMPGIRFAVGFLSGAKK